jgi:hypothetical protein
LEVSIKACDEFVNLEICQLNLSNAHAHCKVEGNEIPILGSWVRVKYTGKSPLRGAYNTVIVTANSQRDLHPSACTHAYRHMAQQPESTITEPPKLYGPHAPVIVHKTSDGYACTPDNLRRSVGCPHRTPIQLHLTTHTRINKRVTTTLQHLLQNFTSEYGRITTMNL